MNITIELTEEVDKNCANGAITNIESDVLLNSKKIGTISAILVDRENIPNTRFYKEFEEHSDDMSWIGCALMESHDGSTKLESLAEYDDPELGFLLIKEFEVQGTDEVKAQALRRFLRHPVIRGDCDLPGVWYTSSFAYVLNHPIAEKGSSEPNSLALWLSNSLLSGSFADEFSVAFNDILNPFGVSSSNAEVRDGIESMKEASPFLRNGFFQDDTLVAGSGAEARILVASCAHLDDPLKTQSQVEAIKLIPGRQTVKDKELFEFIDKYCNGKILTTNSAPVGEKIAKLVSQGATVANSGALHAACSTNNFELVKLFMKFEPACVNALDSESSTPLMAAAENAAGRTRKDGINDTRVIDFLLANGADTSVRDGNGLTAFGRYKTARGAMRSLSTSQSELTLLTKLEPSGGPSGADLASNPDPTVCSHNEGRDEVEISIRAD